MAVLDPFTREDGRRGYRVSNPATLEPIGEFLCASNEEVRQAVDEAREAQREWAQRPLKERIELVGRAIGVIQERQEEIIDAICADTGRGRVESYLMELIPTFDVIAWACNNAQKQLADRKVRPQTLLATKSMTITYRPLGVVGVIVPWNGPFVLSINPTVPALLAGNAVVIKPSEVTPFAGSLVEEIFEAAGLPKGLVRVVKGDGAVGAALIESGIQKLSFTGSTATGRKVAASCGQHLVAFSLELGGKDAAIVCADANIDRAAKGVAYGALFNTGQFCCATERVYVVRSVAEEFTQKLVDYVKSLHQSDDGTQDLSALTMPRQIEIIEDHVNDAIAKGAKILTGGARNDALRGIAYLPTVLTDVNHSMKIMRDETFGPVIPIMVVEDENEALALANDSIYGLSGTVWTKDKKKGLAIAKQMETGSVNVNESSVTFGVHKAPFGGAKQSGVGFVHGEDTLRHFTRQVPVIIDLLGLKEEQNWYPLTEKKYNDMKGFMSKFYGSKLFRKLA